MPGPDRGAVARFSRFVVSMEERPWSAGRVALVLAGIIALRNLLEVIVANNPAPSMLALFAHYPLAYVGPFLALTLTLSAWSGVAPLRVGRLMVLAWTLTLVPPLVDLLLHPGADRPVIAYLQADPVDLPFVWARFFDPSVALTGTTPGIRVETLAAVLLGALYAWLRSGRVFRAVGAAVTVYAVSLFFFSLPLLVQVAFDSVLPPGGKNGLYHGQATMVRANVDAADDATATLWLVLLLLALGALWERLERRLGSAPAVATRRPLTADAVIPAAVALAFVVGIVSAAWLSRPVDVAVVLEPWDLLATLAGTAWIVIATRFALGGRRRSDVRAGLGLIALAAVPAAVGAPAALGLAAAAGVLLPIGTGIAPRSGVPGTAVRATLSGLSAFAAVHAGYGLVEATNAAARMPARLAAPAVLAAVLAAALPRSGRASRTAAWVVSALAGALIAAFALAGGTGSILVGLAVLAAMLTLAAGTICAAAARLAAETTAARLAGVALGVWGLAVTGLALNQAPVRDALRSEVRCVARLELLRGMAYEDAGGWTQAQTAYRRALACQPDYVPALRALGIGEAKHAARPERGLGHLERALELAPDSPAELNNLASLYVMAGRPADALPLLERSLAIDPRHPLVHLHRARAFDSLGRTEDALAAWEGYVRAARGRESEKETLAVARERIRVLRKGTRDGNPPN